MGNSFLQVIVSLQERHMPAIVEGSSAWPSKYSGVAVAIRGKCCNKHIFEDLHTHAAAVLPIIAQSSRFTVANGGW